MIALSLGEVKEILENSEDSEIKSFVKKFVKIDDKKAKEIKEELEKLEIIKIKQTDIVKIIDYMPEDSSDLNKIVTETILDEDETEKILGVIKKHI